MDVEGLDRKPYELLFQPDGVFLRVTKPVGSALIVTDTEVLDEVRRLHIHGFNANLIAEIVLKEDGKAYKIAETQVQEKINVQIEVTTSPDKMKAFILMRAPEGGGAVPFREQLYTALKDKGVVYGLDAETIDDLAKYPVYGQNIQVATGTIPVNGKNGAVTYLVELKKDVKPTILEDGTVDYKDMNIVENVSKGQIIARLSPPTPSKSGYMVTNIEIKGVDGKPAVFVKGKNLVISQDGNALISDIDGQVMYADGKISIFSTFEVKSDVDNSTGNIHVIGNVSVRGNVLAGFTIEAGGNVEVEGVAESATIRAGGNIILKRGMIGNSKGILSAGGDIISKYIENSIVEAKGDIKAEAIMHSDLKCGNKLELGGKKGLLVGGVSRVGREIEAKVIGSPMSTVTVLEVGIDPNLRERLKVLRAEVPPMDENLHKSNQAITLLKRLDSAGALTDDKREMLAKSTRSKFFYEAKLIEYKKEIVDIETRLQQEASGKVKVLGNAYNGVRVSIGSCSMYVKETLTYCTLYRDGADVRVGPL